MLCIKMKMVQIKNRIPMVLSTVVLAALMACTPIQQPDYGTEVEGISFTCPRQDSRFRFYSPKVVRFADNSIGIRVDIEVQMKTGRGRGIAAETVSKFKNKVQFKVIVLDAESKVIEESIIAIQRARKLSTKVLVGEIKYIPKKPLEQGQSVTLRVVRPNPS